MVSDCMAPLLTKEDKPWTAVRGQELCSEAFAGTEAAVSGVALRPVADR
jgi:hypothetical protein